MRQHPNARLTPRGRERLVERVLGGEPVGEVARQMCVSHQTASKWLARAKALAPFIDHYNWDRPHNACGGLPPMSRIVGVNNVLARNT